VNQSTESDITVSVSPVASNEIRNSEQILTTAATTQPLCIPSSPILQRRRIDEPTATNIVSDNPSYLNIRSTCRKFREFDN
jgi:hypothetical protein